MNYRVNREKKLCDDAENNTRPTVAFADRNKFKKSNVKRSSLGVYI